MGKLIYKKQILKDISTESLIKEQLSVFHEHKDKLRAKSYWYKLIDLLNGELSFHNVKSNGYPHNIHSFPAKFPPQLPKVFIQNLTDKGDIVLDPMVGSGTTAVEALINGRMGLGFDIDPLAIKISNAKTSLINESKVIEIGWKIYNRTKKQLSNNHKVLLDEYYSSYPSKTLDFFNFWFLKENQLELFLLQKSIKAIEDDVYRNFFEVIFSSIIITKSGGVSLALDLGHTRPHRVKALIDSERNVLFGEATEKILKKKHLVKLRKSAIEEFRKRISNYTDKDRFNSKYINPKIKFGDSQNLELDNESVDLIFTSPPYASNAIDYMRAHKFSLAWFGYNLEMLTEKRSKYIGAENVLNYKFEKLPGFTTDKINQVKSSDIKKGKVLHRYYSEMKKSISEMYRVLKPGKAAIVVVGSSRLRGIDTETHICLSEIGRDIGFHEPIIGIRELDRNKRMLPVSAKKNITSQIQNRMHEEYVIAFYKKGKGLG